MGNIINYLEFFQKKWRQVFVIALTVTLFVALYTTFFVKNQYEGQIKLYLGKEKFQNVTEVYNNEEVTMYQKLMKTYGELARTKKLVKSAIDNSKLDVTVSEVLDNLSVVPMSDTQIMQIKYSSNNKQKSYDVVYAITKELIDFSQELYPKGNIKVLEQTSVSEENLPIKKAKIIILGLISGIFIGIVTLLIFKFMNNTFISRRELEEDINIPVIGVIPQFRE